jgi:hypothetical protein
VIAAPPCPDVVAACNGRGGVAVTSRVPCSNARLPMLHSCAARCMDEVEATPHTLSVTVFLGQTLNGKGSPAALLTKSSKAVGLQSDPMGARGNGTCLPARSVFFYCLAEHCCSLSVFPQRLPLWGMGWCTWDQPAEAAGLCRKAELEESREVGAPQQRSCCSSPAQVMAAGAGSQPEVKWWELREAGGAMRDGRPCEWVLHLGRQVGGEQTVTCQLLREWCFRPSASMMK